MLIDTHAHLAHRMFGEGEPRTPQSLLSSARAAGVGAVVHIACRPDEWAPAIQLAEAHDNLYFAAGIHPCDVNEFQLEEQITQNPPNTLANLTHALKHPKCVAVGECGLDYHYPNTNKTLQHNQFTYQLRLAHQNSLPVTVHSRDAEADTLAILAEHAANISFIIHCFSGSPAFAEKALALGGYISFSGIATFKKSNEIRSIAASVPPNRILVETDSPYLAPEPFRGKRCEPAYTLKTAEVLAESRGVSYADFAAQTTANAQRIFTKMQIKSGS